MTSHPPLLFHQPAPEIVRASHQTMRSVFEIFIANEDPAYARQAADAAFEECDRLERELSRFIPSSDISQINACQPGWSVCVGAAALELLELAQRIHGETDGAFDVTVGALMDGEAGPVGIGLLAIDPATREVTRKRPGLKIDLGGIGKGYALDQMAVVLREWGIGTALLHAGQSSALAVGGMADGSPWRLGLRDPREQAKIIGQVSLLAGRALSGSGVQLAGQHILDPRTGKPATGKLAAWAIAPTAALSDAISTAFMVMSAQAVREYCGKHVEISGLLLIGETGNPSAQGMGEFEHVALE
jgi:thiamine biosynthesis lipoprotein